MIDKSQYKTKHEVGAQGRKFTAQLVILKSLDKTSKEYQSLLSKVYREHMYLATKLAKPYKKMLAYNEHYSYFFQALVCTVDDFDPDISNASTVIMNRTMGYIMNAYRPISRRNKRNQRDGIEVHNTPDTRRYNDRLSVDIFGNVIEVNNGRK